MNSNSIFQSKLLKGILYGIGISIILLIVFQVGVLVGYRKGSLSSRRINPNPRNQFLGVLEGKDFTNAHGISGTVLKVDTTSVVLKEFDGMEKTVSIDKNTVIKDHRNTVSLSDIKVNDRFIVIGTPNGKGQIQANFIRVLPNANTKTNETNSQQSLQPPTSQSQSAL